MKLICVFVFAYAKKRFFHDAAQLIVRKPGHKEHTQLMVQCLIQFSDDLDKLEDWSDEEELGTEGNTEGVSVSMSERQKKESRGNLVITQTHLIVCNVLRYFTAGKTIIFRGKIVIFFLLLLKT